MAKYAAGLEIAHPTMQRCCAGNFDAAHCIDCGHEVPISFVKAAVLSGEPYLCPRCNGLVSSISSVALSLFVSLQRLDAAAGVHASASLLCASMCHITVCRLLVLAHELAQLSQLYMPLA